eukprot:CAMPEP_0182472174 /NCGR_PEP_ID=MMETSP1319-20130603/21661_1 /TAXON_ID=172717 /ORGANISM="Bolidomonas pacifica, Strain RCC208" /LENGTH=389 /DNA_ID=CAMNT_0024672817 /DNA_START=15 /DNA_END=1180 /DNA_ORIENTATION=-
MTATRRRQRRGAIVYSTLQPDVQRYLQTLQADNVHTHNPQASHHGLYGRRKAICQGMNASLLPPANLEAPPRTIEPVTPELLSSLAFDVRENSVEELEARFAQFFADLQLGRDLHASPAAVAMFVANMRMMYDTGRHNVRDSEPGVYHNFIHAFDVAQACHHMIVNSSVGQLLDPTGQATLLVAALCHDAGHGGLTNAFLAASDDPLTARFGANGTLEHLHAHLTLRQLEEETEDGGLLSGLSERDSARFMRDVELAILATDMSRHREILDSAGVHAAAWAEALEAREPLPHGEARTALLSLLLKCADISNVARPWDLSLHWAELLMEEFHRQGDAEQLLGLPISMNCSRENDTSISRMVGGFIDFLASAAFEQLAAAVPGTDHLLHQV